MLNSAYRNRRTPRGVRAFTLVELLVVMVVIGILLSILLVGSSAAVESVRRSRTQATFRNITLAIDSFAQIDPLRQYYNPVTRLGSQPKTFGPYPPYQIDVTNFSATSVASQFEPVPALSLAQRLTRDLAGLPGAGIPQTGQPNWVLMQRPDRNDDIRALYSYLRAFDAAGFAQIPAESRDELPRLDPEFRNNPTAVEVFKLPGSDPLPLYDPTPGALNEDWADIGGFYDAWGVPLDYLLYVKVELRVADVRRPDEVAGAGARPPTVNDFRPTFVVTDRRFVLRSKGVSKEQYDLVVNQRSGNTEYLDDTNAIYSAPLPEPYAADNAGSLRELGNLTVDLLTGQGGGWVRVPEALPPTERNRLFYGYLPPTPSN